MSVLPQRTQRPRVSFETAAPMFAAGPALDIVQWNAGAEALTGFTEEDVLGRRCWELLRCPEPMRRIHCGCAFRPDGAAGDPVPAFDQELVTKSGERVWVSVTTVLAGSDGEAPVRVHVLRELKRERQLEELLRQVVHTAAKLTPGAGGRDGEGERPGGRPRVVTSREREVVRLLAQGSSTGEIAARLGISPRTARNHIQNILCKLRVHSRLEAVAYASARGLV